jgi:phage-related protein
MERLLADAEKLTGKKYDINNLSDVYEAIHAIQKQMGITNHLICLNLNSQNLYLISTISLYRIISGILQLKRLLKVQ